MHEDERYCECAYCGIGHHCDEGKDGADCPECGEWNGIIILSHDCKGD